MSDKSLEQIGKWVRSVRESTGLGQREFAVLVGYTDKSMICRIENGHRMPTCTFLCLMECIDADPDLMRQLLESRPTDHIVQAVASAVD